MHILLRGDTLQRLRLASGLVLFTFVATHFLNHALGLVSLEAMLEMQAWRKAVTRSTPGTVLLAAAIATHVALALWKIARRATLRLPAWEWAQLASGLAIPYLLAQHVVYNRGAATLAGTNDTYRVELANLWPAFALDQTLLLLIVWTHACIGLHYWLRLAKGYSRVQPVLFALAVLLPALALAGFAVAGRQVAAELARSGALEALHAAARSPDGDTAARLTDFKSLVQWGFLAAAALALAWPLSRSMLPFSKGRLKVRYRAGPQVASWAGPTLLEISRMHGVPHTSVCGGRARCTTCRVRVEDGLPAMPPPVGAEAAALRAIGAREGVRLACQLRPPADLGVERLVAFASARRVSGRDAADETGIERTLAVLFFDLRGFTALSDRKLPYDVVFLLNRIFTAAADAVRAEGGRIDKYMGDGMMALFGNDCDADTACRQALAAARAIDHALDKLNEELAAELPRPLACAMGLHVGPLVLGRIGCQQSATVTVIGTTVNAASRLESLAKEKGCQLVVSRQVLRRAGVTPRAAHTEKVAVRGIEAPLSVAAFPRARQLDLPR